MANKEDKPVNNDDLITLLGKVSPPKNLNAKVKTSATESLPEELDVDKPTEDEPEELNEPIEEPEDELEIPPKQIKTELIEPEFIQQDKVIQELLPSDLIAPIKEEDSIGIKILLTKFGTTVDSIIQNYEKDRGQIDKAIEFFETEVRDAQKAGKKLSPAFVEGWAKLLSAKAEINMSATSSLDSIAKLLSAGKGNELVISLSGNVQKGTLDLEALLKQPDPEE